MAVDRNGKAMAARPRKRRMDRVEHDLSDDQWTTLKVAWGGCAYCGATGRPLQREVKACCGVGCFLPGDRIRFVSQGRNSLPVLTLRTASIVPVRRVPCANG